MAMEAQFMEYYGILEEQENRVLRTDELARLNAVNRKLREMVTAGGHRFQDIEEQDEQDLSQVKKLQIELVELRRVNKELQQHKRHLSVQLAAAQARVAALLSKNERVEAEAAELRPVNEELSRQVEGLQNNRFSEVEELVYLRWVNACLRYELRHPDGSHVNSSSGEAMQLNKDLSPKSQEKAKNLMLQYAGPDLLSLTSSSTRSESDHEDYGFSSLTTTATTTTSSSESGELSSDDMHMPRPRKASLIKKFRETWGKTNASSRKPLDCNIARKSTLENLSSSSSSIAESFQIMSRSATGGEIADRYPSFKDRHKLDMYRSQTEKGAQDSSPPPPASSKGTNAVKPAKVSTASPPPPPPPPLPMFSTSAPAAAGVSKTLSKFRRAPQVIELYHSMMKREKQSAKVGGSCCSVADARSNMIGEIENRSAHMLAIKADVQNQGQFVESMAAEIRAAEFTSMADVSVFVNWLDEELSLLVDERAVLKHFIWPEAKVDALRESASEYQKLIKLEQQVAFYEDDRGIRRDEALKRMQLLLERIEQSVYGFLRTRDAAVCRYKEYKIPAQWMLDAGLIAKVKQSSVKLAEQFMKRVVSEINSVENEPLREFLVLQGVRFAFRVHQFAGGFDEETMRAFELLQTHAPNHSRPCM